AASRGSARSRSRRRWRCPRPRSRPGSRAADACCAASSRASSRIAARRRPDIMESEELILTRILDRTASHDDWVAFEEIARRAAGAWDRLHQELRDDLLLRGELEPALSIADGVELPRVVPVPPLSRFLAPAGWLAAVVMALLWIGSSRLFGATERKHVEQDREAITAGDPTWRKDPGSLLEVLPSDVLQMKPREDGSVEMIYLKQTV